MTGIVSYGAYVPFYRLDRGEVARAWGRPPTSGQRAVANHDEDIVTMAVAAALDCIGDTDRNTIDGLYLASTSFPYREKQCASIVAAACDLRREVATLDFANSLRSATGALGAAIDAVSAGSMGAVLVVAADCRLGLPQSEAEVRLGDGAAAVLVGRSDVVATVDGRHAISDDLVDVWRNEDDVFIRSWEERFIIAEGYTAGMEDGIRGLLERLGLSIGDFSRVVLSAPDSRSHTSLAKGLGFDPRRQVQDPLLDKLGSTGVASTLMTLGAALGDAKPGDRILLASHGDGADVFALSVTENAGRRQGTASRLQSRTGLISYEKYLCFRGIIPQGSSRRPPAVSSSSKVWRDRQGIIRFHGVRCSHCGTVLFPPSRVCIGCQARDGLEPIRLSDKKARVFSFATDQIIPSPDPPVVTAVIDFEGGGRFNAMITDCTPQELEIGMPVEMTFRYLHQGGDFRNYFWKARPAR